MTQAEMSKMIDDTIAEQDEAQREEELEDLLDLLGFDDQQLYSVHWCTVGIVKSTKLNQEAIQDET